MNAVLFDLDGTLADTERDIVASIIEVFAANKLPLRPSEALRKAAGNGRPALLRAALEQQQLSPAQMESISGQFVEVYTRRMYETTCLYPGVKEMLATLDADGITWGIVTNKTHGVGEPLIRWLGIAGSAACIVYGDTTRERKPSPQPLLHAVAQISVPPQQCVFVGDTLNDVKAGKSAGITTVIVTQTAPATEVSRWEPDAVIARTPDVLGWLSERTAQPAPLSP